MLMLLMLNYVRKLSWCLLSDAVMTQWHIHGFWQFPKPNDGSDESMEFFGIWCIRILVLCSPTAAETDATFLVPRKRGITVVANPRSDPSWFTWVEFGNKNRNPRPRMILRSNGINYCILGCITDKDRQLCTWLNSDPKCKSERSWRGMGLQQGLSYVTSQAKVGIAKQWGKLAFVGTTNQTDQT